MTTPPTTTPTAEERIAILEHAITAPFDEAVAAAEGLHDDLVSRVLNERLALQDLTELLDSFWQLLYPGKTDWEYPGQVLNHLRCDIGRYTRLRAMVGAVEFPVVALFAARMVAELKVNAHKGHWAGADERVLFDEVCYHVRKLELALFGEVADAGDPFEFAADVANLCMMLIDNRGLLKTPPAGSLARIEDR